jgi:two-component system sensor histidine kinase/response regulator
MKILVIDDDVCVARAVQRRLRGHEVTIETNPRNAVTLVEGADLEGTPFDAVLCDFNMPGMSGVELLATLRANPDPPMLILMSGYDDVVEAGFVADCVLLKPFETSEILDVIERLQLARSRATTRRLPRVRSTTRQRHLNA